MDEVSGPSVGQAASVDVFDALGRRLHLAGRISWVDAGTLVLALASGGERVLGLGRGTRAMVECQQEQGGLRFLSTVLELKLERGVQMVLEAPPYVARLQSRRFARHGLKVPVTCTLPGGSRCAATTEDLGGNGARLASDRPVGVGAQVGLEFDLGGARCRGTGQVKHVTRAEDSEGAGWLWGVELVRMDAEDLACLWEFLRRHGGHRA